MKYKIFTKNQIINLFSIFVMSTVGILFWLFLYIRGVNLQHPFLMIILLGISVLFYLTIIYSVIVYYFSRWGFFLFNQIDRNRETFIFWLEVFIGIISIIGTSWYFKSFWMAIISLPSVILIIAAMPPASDWIKKWYKSKRKK